MFKIGLLMISLICLLSCSKPDADTVTDLPVAINSVITANKDCICEPVMDQYLFKGNTIFHHYYTGPACNTMSVFYDVNGNIISKSFDALYIQMIDESVFVKNVWKCRPSTD